MAALSTRPAKDLAASIEASRAEWQERAAGLGVESGLWPGLTGRVRQLAGLDAPGVAERLLGPDGLTAQRSWFDRRDVLRAVADLAGDGLPVAGIEALAASVLADPRVVELSVGVDGRRWSTVELVGLERQPGGGGHGPAGERGHQHQAGLLRQLEGQPPGWDASGSTHDGQRQHRPTAADQ